MRCKKHLSDFSSNIGVCATCLREKLFSLIQAQSNLNSFSLNPNPNPNFYNHDNHNHHHHHDHQKKSPPLIFPRSVSPYITRRKSDHTVENKSRLIQRFYSTPQVGPTFEKKKSTKFNLIAKLFRSKSTVASSELRVIPNELTQWRNRGMSPQNEWENDSEKSTYFDSPASRTRPSPGRVKASPARLANNVASLAFCLSPLVRASPASRYHWSGGEPSFSGEIRVPVTGKSTVNSSCSSGSNNKGVIKPQLHEAASFTANRSRKLADFGRLNRNR